MSGIYFNFIFARCAGCGYPIKSAADARTLDGRYFCPVCYESERKKPFQQMELFK